MKIGIVGGGPAGLFFAYLMKRLDPAHAIRVVERDPADATYGWGVVFSDIALSFVRDAAPDLYAAITDGQEVFDSMRIVHRDVAVPLPNNTFHRMSRIHLLHALREHCASARRGDRVRAPRRRRRGVRRLRLGRRRRRLGQRDPHALRGALRARDSTSARTGSRGTAPRRSSIRCRSSSARTTHGLFIAHAYRFSRTHSTFLVEVDP